MGHTRLRRGRNLSIGGVLAVVVITVAVPVALLATTATSGADTSAYAMTCTPTGGSPGTQPGMITTGTISANPVRPGGTFSIANYGFVFNVGPTYAAVLNGVTISGTFVTSLTAVGATPTSVNTTITFPPFVEHSSNPPVPGHGSSPTFTADPSGATSVSVSPGSTGTLTLDIGAPLNATEVSACVITSGSGQPITPPVLDTVSVAVPAGTVAAVLPNAGRPAGGTRVKIVGSNLGEPTKVDFGAIPATSFGSLTTSSVEAVAPPGAVGTVDVRVFTEAGESAVNAGDQFTYTNGPIVTAVRPSSGQPDGGAAVTIDGSGFTGATSVSFGSRPASTFVVKSNSIVSAVVPPGSGVVDVTVRGPSGTSVRSSQDRFSYFTGYRLASSGGGVYSYGNAPFEGSAAGLGLRDPVVGMATTPDGAGYWLVASDGGVFAYGDAVFSGSAAGQTLNATVVGIAPTPDGFGYWLVAADGGVFAYGDAMFFGSAGNLRLNAPIVGIAPTPDGGGYWLVAADGGVFAYGDASFYGSATTGRLAYPVVGISPTANGGGYWLTTSGGAVVNYGDAQFLGTAGGLALRSPVDGIATTRDGGGYLLVGGDGGVFAYGDAVFAGSAVGIVPLGVVDGVATS